MMTGVVICSVWKILKVAMLQVSHFMLTGRQLKTVQTGETRKEPMCFHFHWIRKNILKEISARSHFQAAREAVLLYLSKTAQASFNRNGWNHSRDKPPSHSIQMS